MSDGMSMMMGMMKQGTDMAIHVVTKGEESSKHDECVSSRSPPPHHPHTILAASQSGCPAREADCVPDDRSFIRMVGAGKPNRSEEQGTLEDQQRHADQVRAYLDATAPKRQLKPSRSDAEDLLSSLTTTTTTTDGSDPPEHVKYLHLVANGVPLDTKGAPGGEGEEYTESEYYRHMAAIDKAHHTTGTGFIKMDKPEAFRLAEEERDGAPRERRGGNPAMNDWEPAERGADVPSSKPLRSESASDL